MFLRKATGGYEETVVEIDPPPISQLSAAEARARRCVYVCDVFRVLCEACGIWRVFCDALRACRDALREGRSIVYTKKIQRKIILDGAASKGQPLHRACAANRFAFIRTTFGGHNI